jgi:hypothetical protein
MGEPPWKQTLRTFVSELLVGLPEVSIFGIEAKFTWKQMVRVRGTARFWNYTLPPALDGTEKRDEAERIAQNSLPCEMEIGLNPQRLVCDLTLDSSNHPS